MKFLITGANGYIGIRLLTALSETEHEVVAVVRNKDRLPPELCRLFQDRLSIVEFDFLNEPERQVDCPDDIDVAYYLIHSMGSGEGFHRREKQCAQHFVEWVKTSRCKQIVYLSGLTPADEHGSQLSTHLASRQQVHASLQTAKAPVTTLRASIIVGSGSASFEIIRDLVEKLPFMITPKWAKTRCQPISIRNVIDYLLAVPQIPECLGKAYDIGGPDIMTYRDMLMRYARARKLTRFIIPVPFFSPRLSSYWLSLVTATHYQVAKALVGSLHMETICKENKIRDLIPLDLIPYPEAIQRALSIIAQNRVPSTWYGALSSGQLSHHQITNIQVPEFGVLTDKKSTPLTTENDQVVDAVWALGGGNGWPSMLWAWRLRGWMDKLVGGIGMRRGRRSQNELKPGDALDFWRVIVADKENGRLTLYAEMKLPGEAWLEFQIEHGALYQTATFRPKGLFGRLYWYSTLPFHMVLFPRMVSSLANGWPERPNHTPSP
ncbi:SDR family oxidoreductase [Verrucomicrobiaceae bacterium N1E253]|uniref:SDR family oxidoreductase n=1 Tax=Oceaniferula marina TaxID=2748318 RepID=A0A851GMP6_9BACT|nr:SDR family oxidoreductase [Oceaniferula marina]NWK57111.1 SDR family oxidoreductase [Oceaniferula marina]